MEMQDLFLPVGIYIDVERDLYESSPFWSPDSILVRFLLYFQFQPWAMKY